MLKVAPVFGIQEFVRWHTIAVAALLVGMLTLFFIPMRVYVVAPALLVASLMSLALLGLWVAAYSSDNTLHAREVWGVTPVGGLVPNCVLVAALLCYVIFLALAGRRGRARH